MPSVTERAIPSASVFEGWSVVDEPEVALEGLTMLLGGEDIEDVREFMDQTALGSDHEIIPSKGLSNASCTIMDEQLGAHATAMHLMQELHPALL